MKQRLLTVAWTAPIVIGAVSCTHSVPVGVLIALVAVVALRELANLQKSYWISVTGSLLLLAVPFVDQYNHLYLHIANLALLLIGVFACVKWFETPRLLDLAGLWVAAPMASAFLLHGGDTKHWWFDVRTPLLMAVLPVWGGDSAAIFAGKAFGKHLLAPSISPKKTWEGAIANLIAATLGAWLVGTWVHIPMIPSLVCGFAAGVLGQAGDLFESWLKRRADAKDSGNLLPGHGGLLDRVDSLLFTIVAVSFILTAFGCAR